MLSTRKADVKVYGFGLITLHAWIRFSQHLPHISYKLEVKKWQVGKQDREKDQKRKRLIKENFPQKRWAYRLMYQNREKV
jgi:hypothetical protein